MSPAEPWPLPRCSSGAFSASLAPQQGHTIEILGGLQRQFHEAMAEMMAESMAAGKGGSGDCVKRILKPSLYEGDQQHAEWSSTSLLDLRAVVCGNADQWLTRAGEHRPSSRASASTHGAITYWFVSVVLLLLHVVRTL